MKTNATLFGFLITATLVLAGCFFTPWGSRGTSSASISVSMKQPTAPLTSIALIVSGPDMSTIAKSVDPQASELILEVPAGSARTFTLLINTFSVTFKGQTTVDLKPGEETVVDITPTLEATQIIIPDSYNYRIVQISDMNGTGWTEVDYSQLGLGMVNGYEFYPYDIDFDKEGRIYVANSSDGVIRLDDINDTSAEWVVKGAGAPYYVNSIAIDRVRDLLYFTIRYDQNVYQADLSKTPPWIPVLFEVILEPEITSFDSTGMAVDEEGFLYLANISSYQIIKYNPQAALGSRVVGIYNTNLGFPWDGMDVVTKDGFVYLASHDSPTYVIQRLDQNLDFIDGFGSMKDPPQQAGEFWSPYRFVAILNKKLYVLDDGTDPITYNPVSRVVSFGNASGEGWETYGKYGTGIGEFDFPFSSGC